MLKVWAILLLGGLLTPSEGLGGPASIISSLSGNGLGQVIDNLLHSPDILKGPLGILPVGNRGLLNLGNLLGTGLIGLEIKNLTLPKVSLKLLPGVGVQVNVYTQVLTEGKGLAGNVLKLQVGVNITARARLTQDNTGAPKFVVENCKTQLVDVRVLNGLRLQQTVLKNILGNLFPGVLCPLIDTTLNTVNPLLSTVNSVVPLGVVGSLQYTLASVPVVSDAAIGLDLNAAVKDLLGNNIVDLTCSATAISLPSVVGSSSQLGLPVCLLSSVLKLLLVPEKLSTDILLPISLTSAIRKLVPQVSGLLPDSQQPLLKIRVLDTPAVSVQNGKVLVHLPASIEVFPSDSVSIGVSPSDSPRSSLFVLDADIVLGVQPTVSDNKLHISVTLERVGLSLASSLIGDFSVLSLEPLISDLLGAEFLPLINDALKMDIPLPSLLNLDWADGLVKVINNALLINSLA